MKTVETKRGNNMHKSLLLSFTAILLCASVALAKSSGPSTQTVKLTIKGSPVLVHCPSGPVFPTGAEAAVPLIVSLTVWVDGPELFASATRAQSKMAVKDSRRDYERR